MKINIEIKKCEKSKSLLVSLHNLLFFYICKINMASSFNTRKSVTVRASHTTIVLKNGSK